MTDKFACAWEDFKKVLEAIDCSACGVPRSSKLERESVEMQVQPLSRSHQMEGYCRIAGNGHREGELKYDCPACRDEDEAILRAAYDKYCEGFQRWHWKNGEVLSYDEWLAEAADNAKDEAKYAGE